MTTVTRGKEYRKMSQATLRSLTDKDLFFDLQAPPSTPKPPKVAFEFQAGKKYLIRNTGNPYTLNMSDHIFVYQYKQGKHHFFKHWLAGYTVTFTDPQLIGKVIQEVKQ